MANRFLETNYYKSPFVRGLKGALKGLYSFIICDCTPDGIWNKDLQAASLYIGFSITEEEFNESFVLTGKSIDIGRGKYFFPDFIEHQYPSGLQSWNKSHNKIIIELNKYNFLSEKKEVKGTIYYIEKKGASKGLQSTHIRVQGNGNGNGNVLNGVVFEKREQAIGSELTQTCANKSWSDQRWRENICMGNSIKENELKKWMGNFNASICNDSFPHFDEHTYKKLFRGWLQKQVGKGYNVNEIKSETKVDILKKVN